MQDFSRRKQLYGPDPATDQKEHHVVATATTLPNELPVKGTSKPFTVMLGSCFYRSADPDGLAGKTFYDIPPESQPDVKILCGDQVYLDNPWLETTTNVRLTFSPKEYMRQLFFRKYVQNWTQLSMEDGKAVGGFNLLLRHGANYFASDDHEYWNNAPNLGFVGLALTLVLGQRRFWFREGAELFKVFQSLSPWMTFNVPPISFCIADTRINRNIKGIRFLEEDDLDAIQHWIKHLEGPGILCLGQPMLVKKSSFWGRSFDRGLPDYDAKFAKLRDMVSQSKHSIVLLTGDVHFGRYSECDLRMASENESLVPKFVEVISSPMRIVDGFLGKGELRGYEPAFNTFGTPVQSIEIAKGYNHFVTLEFTKSSLGVDMKVLEWPIPDTKKDTVPTSKAVAPSVNLT